MRTKPRSPSKPDGFERTDPSFGIYIDFPDTGPASPVKFSKHYFVKILAEGKPVGIHRKSEHATFSKLFQRNSHENGLGMKLSVRQVRQSLWLLIARKATEPKPGNKLAGDCRKNGRKVWYVSQLESGKIVEVATIEEARKARRAWMLYIPKGKRGGRECVIQTKGKLQCVSVQQV